MSAQVDITMLRNTHFVTLALRRARPIPIRRNNTDSRAILITKQTIAIPLIRHADSIDAIRTLGHDGIAKWLRKQRIRFQQRTIDRVLAWAARAAVPQLACTKHHAIAMELDKDRTQKTLEIQALERDLASRLACSPYILLLSIPGVNVVSAADCAGEIGPM
jgi:hypothetical protein